MTIEILDFLQSTWTLVIAFVSNVFSGFLAFYLFRKNNWQQRKLSLFEDLRSGSKSDRDFKKVLDRAREEEEFNILFQRPSTPSFRKAVYKSINCGNMSFRQFKLSKSYFDVDDAGQLQVDMGWMTKFARIFYPAATVLVSIYYAMLFTLLLAIESWEAYATIAGLSIVFFSMIGVLIKESLAVTVAAKVSKKQLVQVES